MDYPVNREKWLAYWMDTPLCAPGGHTAEEAAQYPGNAVKSLEREGGMGLPKYFGVLAVYQPRRDRAVVISHRHEILPEWQYRVWEGSVTEYHQLWRVD